MSDCGPVLPETNRDFPAGHDFVFPDIFVLTADHPLDAPVGQPA